MGDDTPPPFTFFPLQVLRSTRLSPSMQRITLGGTALDGFASGGFDQSFSLFLPRSGQQGPALPTGDDWFTRWRAMDPAERAVMRSYTVRAQRPGELDVDFVRHGTEGPASRWAGTAAPGDRVTLLGPTTADNKSVGFRPPPGTDAVLLSGDETAFPALAAILERLPDTTAVRAWIEVPHTSDIQPLESDIRRLPAGTRLTWLARDTTPRHRSERMLEAVRTAALPGDRPYAWIAGESGTVKELRRHLLRERGLARTDITFAGYWRLGASEERLAEEAATGIARIAED